MNIVRRKEVLLDILEIQGRIDGLTAPEIKRAFDLAVNEGHRQLVVDFMGVTYLSSAGLRIILETHKSLRTIGGELILLSIPQMVSDVFRVSGMAPLLNIFSDLSSLRKHLNATAEAVAGTRVEHEGISFEMISLPAEPGAMILVGNPDKIMQPEYAAGDIVKVSQSDMRFGTGISAVGDSFKDVHDLFGESVILNHHYFSLPAVRRPIVDYSFYAEDLPRTISFMHGFGFRGDFTRILHFESSGKPLTVDKLAHAAGNFATTSVFGIVFLALSGGILGMHLKRSPVMENRPPKPGIMEPENFHDWLSYPLEEECLHKTVVATGIAAKEIHQIKGERMTFFPSATGIHLHAAIFENGLWSNHPGEFENELERVVREFQVEKVVHLLPGSLLLNGFIGIINLKD